MNKARKSIFRYREWSFVYMVFWKQIESSELAIKTLFMLHVFALTFFVIFHAFDKKNYHHFKYTWFLSMKCARVLIKIKLNIGFVEWNSVLIIWKYLISETVVIQKNRGQNMISNITAIYYYISIDSMLFTMTFQCLVDAFQWKITFDNRMQCQTQINLLKIVELSNHMYFENNGLQNINIFHSAIVDKITSMSQLHSHIVTIHIFCYIKWKTKLRSSSREFQQYNWNTLQNLLWIKSCSHQIHEIMKCRIK